MIQAELKQKAIGLRKSGYSYSYILNRVPVSKSTLSGWLASLPYKPNKETISKIGAALSAMIATKQRQKILSIKNANERADKDIGKLSSRDVFMLGLGIYIGEGSKTHQMIRVVNSNPKIISFTIRWFKTVCKMGNNNFTVRLHLYPDNNTGECVRFWSKETGIAVDQFEKIQVDLRKNKRSSKKGKLPYGTAHLTVRSRGNKEFGVILARRINRWMENVLEYTGKARV